MLSVPVVNRNTPRVRPTWIFWRARQLRRARIDELIERRFRSRPDHQIGRIEEYELRLRSAGRSHDLVAEDGVAWLERRHSAREFARDVDDGGCGSDLLFGGRRFSRAGQSTEHDRCPKRLQKGDYEPDSGFSVVVIFLGIATLLVEHRTMEQVNITSRLVCLPGG